MPGCYTPPIEDEVLASLLNATSKNKPGKGVKFWRCGDCRESTSPGETSSMIVVRPPATPASSTASRVRLYYISGIERC